MCIYSYFSKFVSNLLQRDVQTIVQAMVYAITLMELVIVQAHTLVQIVQLFIVCNFNLILFHY